MKMILSLVFVGCAIVVFAQFGFAQTQKMEREPDKPHAVSAAAMEITATVFAIDYEKRTGMLKLPDGTTETFNAGPEVMNFDQVKVGDPVILRATQAR